MVAHAENPSEFIKSSPRVYVVVGYLVILSIFGVLGGWAATATINGAVVASGVVSLADNRKVVQHLEGGTVRDIRVQEADVVTAGDTLIVLDSIEARSNLTLLQQRLNIDRAAEARLLGEHEFAETIEFPADLAASSELDLQNTLLTQQDIFDDRREIIVSEAEILEFRLTQFDEQINGLEIQKNAIEKRIALRTGVVERLTTGEGRGVIETNRLADIQDILIQVETSLGEVISELSRVRGASGEARLSLLKLEQQYRERASLELKEIQDEISELSERIIVAKDDLTRTIILAPVSGSVQNLQVTTNGSVIRPGEILMEIVPEDADLLINARVSPTDIDSVTPGLETEVRFSAFKTKLTEIILGEVQSVSNDVITPDDSSVAPYYLARIYVSDEKMPANMRQRLTAGMPADVVIITGERSVLNYLTSPLTDAISKSLREE